MSDAVIKAKAEDITRRLEEIAAALRQYALDAKCPPRRLLLAVDPVCVWMVRRPRLGYRVYRQKGGRPVLCLGAGWIAVTAGPLW